MTRQHPNILIIISDEHRKDAMGCAGHPIVKTPHLDGLAARGTCFTNAYTPSPMCVPTRASIATGQYIHTIGNWDSASPYDGTARSWMHHLREHGIYTASIGKLHFRSAEDDNGFCEEILPMHVVGGVGWPVGLLRSSPPAYDAAAELAADVGVGTSSYTEYDLQITKAAEDWLQDDARTKAPWAGFISFVSPHYPLTCPEDYARLYDPEDMDMPIGFDNKAEPAHAELRNIRRFFDYDAYFDEQTTKQAKAAYYGLTSFMDNCVGRVLQALETSGQADNTLVIYISDHGEMLGDQGYWTKQVMYEQSAAVPMILAGPDIPKGHMVNSGVSLIDIAATVIDVTGTSDSAFGASLPGVSLQKLASLPDDMGRTILSEYHDGGSTTGTFMIRWQHWKYIYYVGHVPQLFDLGADPDELDDLAISAPDRPDVKNALDEGERRLRTVCDPEEVNQKCFADQTAKIEQLGGEDACLNAFCFNHTPAPAEQKNL